MNYIILGLDILPDPVSIIRQSILIHFIFLESVPLCEKKMLTK